FFSVTAEEEAARKGTLFAFDMEKRDLRASLHKVTKTAEEVRKLNDTVAVRETFHFHQNADSEIAVMCDLFEMLPVLLEAYAGMLESLMSIADKSPFGNHFRKMIKWMLLRYVREMTGQPNYPLVSDLLHGVAYSRGWVVDEERDGLTVEALQKFFDRND